MNGVLPANRGVGFAVMDVVVEAQRQVAERSRRDFCVQVPLKCKVRFDGSSLGGAGQSVITRPGVVGCSPVAI